MKKNTYSGKFIVFEGLDGSGQSTQSALLKDFFLKKGFKVVLTKEPTKKSEAGKKIRKILDKKEKISAKKLQELFVQDRREHLLKIVIPALKKKKAVISDRYFFSTLAYGKSDGLDLGWLISINDKFLLPDITFFLKVSPEICFKRIKERGIVKTLFEKKEKLAQVWRVYETLPKKFKDIYIINGEKPADMVFEDIKKIINKKLI